MKSIITYFIKYPIASNVLLVLLLIFGYFGMTSLRRTFFPERASNIISIQAPYPGASPEEIEVGIVLKIEDNLDGLTGIERITSVSRENLGSVTIEVNTDYETEVILQDIKNEVARISSFPDGMEPPSIYILEPPQLAINFALSGNLNLKELKRIARETEDELLQFKAISKVDLAGFPEEEIEIKLNNAQLKKHQLTITEIASAIKKTNIELTGGMIKSERQEILIRGKNKRYSGKSLEGVVVKTTATGQVLKLGDVATISDSWVDSPVKKEFNDQAAVVVNVRYTLNEDMITVVNRVKEYVKQFNENNQQVSAEIINDRSKVLKERIDLLTKNGLVGFVLVLVVLSMFLHPRLAGWVALGIPISFAGMFVVAAFYGISLNVISLFGMIIVVGILVDDAIVISENIYQHYEKGKPAVQAAIDGTMEVFPAVFSAILTTVIAFSIFFFIDGIMGDLFGEMGVVVIFTLIFSLVEGVIILPTHVAHSKALNRSRKKGFVNKVIIWFTSKLDYAKIKWYKPVLDFSLKYPLVIIVCTACSLMVTKSAMDAGLVKTAFFPSIQGDYLRVDLQLEPGTREHITEQWIDYVQEKVQEVGDEVSDENGGKVITAIEKSIESTPNYARLTVLLVPSEQRSITTDELTELIIKKVGVIPDANSFSIRSSSPFGRPVSVAFFSKDNNELEIIKKKVIKELNDLGTLSNIEASDQKGLLELNLRLKDKAYSLGLSYFEVIAEIRKAFFGQEVQRLQRGLDEVKVWVRFDKENRNSISDLEQMEIRIRGKSFLVKDLVHIDQEKGIVKIEHLDGKKMIKINADLLNEKKTSAGEVLGLLQKEVFPKVLAKHPTVNYSIEGQSREVGKTQSSVGKVGPVILLLIVAVVILTFRSFSQAAAVFIMAIFGIVGVVWGHFIHDHKISLFSVFGMIALVGIMINDALVFITTFNIKMKNGMNYIEALRATGLSRFRPIILTSLTTIAGLLPLIFEKSMQAQFLIPMAIAIAYGLIMATLLTLIFLPSLLQIFNWLRWVIIWLRTGEVRNREKIEPAVREDLGLNEAKIQEQ